jgi:hypothetical protein
MTCPACGREGQAITCIAGNQESRIVFHPDKATHNFCAITAGGLDMEISDQTREQGEIEYDAN